MNTEQKTLPQLDEKFKTCFCRWYGDIQIQQCTLHKAHIDAIHEWAERARAAETKLKEQRDWEPLTDSQIMASIGRHWGGEKTSISQSRPVGQQWEQICELVRCVIRERYISPPAQRKPLTDEQAYEIGAKGGEPSEAERLLFEAWMRGHCWAVIGEWDGKTYVHAHESSGFVHGGAMTTRQLWAAWRDRAALEAAHSIKGDA